VEDFLALNMKIARSGAIEIWTEGREIKPPQRFEENLRTKAS